MAIEKSTVDYIELKRKLQFVTKPLFEFCGAYVNYLDQCYGLNKNDPKINELTSKQLLYTEVMSAFDLRLSEFVKKEINAFSFSNILQSVLKAFLFDFQGINTFESLLKKYDSFSDSQLFNYIGGCFINDHSHSNCEDWPNVMDSMEKMSTYISDIKEISDDIKRSVLELYAHPDETKMRIRHLICSAYEVFKPFESATVEQAKKQLRRYQNLMEIDYRYFCQILRFDEISHVFNDNTRVDLCISYMFPVCYFCKEYDNNTAFLLNGYLCDEYHASKTERQSLENLLGIISDVNCYKMLLCYSKRPYYMQELSRELNIPPAQLRIYNKRFQDADLIDFEYRGKRRHYYLKRDKAVEYLDLVKKMLDN